ncbi:unnamed protein product [Durusdinium trenchii]|uniref:Ubiquitin-like protease family profile domain-containing protein n=1 Tax=Durusdinium trenchii TaxID=1381693 RepID=A0ABP0SLV5_9DINO
MEDEIMLMPLAESGFLEDQQIMACWGWMKWQLKIPDDIFFMEPSLPYRLGLKEGSATMEGAREEILQVTKGMRQVLVPCQGQNPDHWTLLVANRAEDGKFRFRYYETLEVMHKDCLEAAKRLATVLNEDQEPAVFRENTIRQKGADCGFYVVAYSEQAASESKEGPAPRGWPEQIKAAWENRISFIMKVLKQEHEKLMQAKKHVEKLEKERKDKKQAKIKELQDKLKKMKDITTAAAISAQALLDKNSQYFQESSDVGMESEVEALDEDLEDLSKKVQWVRSLEELSNAEHCWGTRSTPREPPDPWVRRVRSAERGGRAEEFEACLRMDRRIW